MSTKPGQVHSERPPTTPAQSSASAQVPFVKHGLTRPGVRALVDNADEIAPSREGFRRFRQVGREETTIHSVDPVTQLLVAQEIAGRADTMWVRHVWTRVAGGYVRARSEMDIVEVIAGRRIRNRGTLVFQNVRVTDAKYPRLIGPEVNR